jgi:hypothetical protein
MSGTAAKTRSDIEVMTDTFSGWTFGNADEGYLRQYRVLRGRSIRVVSPENHSRTNHRRDEKSRSREDVLVSGACRHQA